MKDYQRKRASQNSRKLPPALASALPDRLSLLFILAACIFIGFFIYANVLTGEFQFDDYFYIVNNTTVHAIDNLHQFDRLPHNIRVRYVAFYTFALNYAGHQLDVVGYHVVNILIHILSSFMVFLLAHLILSSPRLSSSTLASNRLPLAVLAGLIFLAHPIQTQAVSYITQRFASLATLFYLGAMNCYLLARLKRKGWWFILAGALAILGMLTKQIVMTLPVMICLVELFLLQEKKARVSWLGVAVLVAMLLIIPAIHGFNVIGLFSETTPSESHDGDVLTNYTYFLTQFRVITRYLTLVVFPWGQNLDYDFPMSHSLLEPSTLAVFLFLVALFGAGVFLIKKEPLIAFGIFWFFITLSVESSIIRIHHVIFEHRMYLPMVGASITLAAVLFRVLKQPLAQRAGIALVILLGVLTFQRNKVWVSEIALWSDVVKKSPQKYRGYYTLGMAYGKKGDTQTMIEYFKKGLRVAPQNAEAYDNLGIVYTKIDVDEAITYFQGAIHVDPHYVGAYTNLGAMYVQKKRTEDAIKIFQEALRVNPRYAPAYNNLGTMYMRASRFQEAKTLFEQALAIDRDYVDARNNLNNLTKYMEKP